MKTLHKTLMGVELFEISSNYIYKLRIVHKDPNEVFSFLPMYTINTNKEAHNQIMLAEYFHRFTGDYENEDEKNEKWLFFNLNTLDSQLNEEISQTGIEDLFKEFDFLKILSNFVPHSDDDLSKFIFPTVHYLIVEITYDVSYDHEGGYDCDMNIDITGYLDDNLEAIYFKK